MTKEEAIIILGNIPINGDECYSIPQYQEAKTMAIDALKFDIDQYCKEHFCVMVDKDVWEKAEKALKQEPCEDAISRREVLNQIFYSTDNSGDVVLGSVLRRRIENLPSVKPQEPKEGHWIEVIDEIDSLGNKTWHHKCSICGNEDSGWGNYKYCPNCGAKMKVGE